MASSAGAVSCQSVKTSPNATGSIDWNTMAPVMLPRARVSLPWRIQVTLLIVSGSSVASGAITSVSTSSSTPKPCARLSMLVTNSSAAPTSMARPTRVWARIWNVFGGSSFVVSKYRLGGSSVSSSCLARVIVLQTNTTYAATSTAAPA